MRIIGKTTISVKSLKSPSNTYPKLFKNRNKPAANLYFLCYNNIKVRNARVEFYYNSYKVVDFQKNFIRKLLETDLFNVFFTESHENFLKDMLWASKKYALEKSYEEHLNDG